MKKIVYYFVIFIFFLIIFIKPIFAQGIIRSLISTIDLMISIPATTFLATKFNK